MIHNTANILKGSPYFAQIPDELLKALVARCERLQLADGSILCREGDKSSELFVILDGVVDVFKYDAAEGEIIVQTLGAGDFLGELAFFDGRPRTATARCRSECELMVLTHTAFIGFGEAYPSIFQHIILALTQRLRERIQAVFDKELAQRTIEMEAELARSRSLAQMVAGVAHELNTPLGIANMTAGMIASRINSAEISTALQPHPDTLSDIREASDLLERNLQRAHKLINSFKKVSVSQLSDTVTTFDLREAITDVLGVMRPTLRKARLDVAVLGIASAEYSGYRGYLTQVLINLLTNIDRYAYDAGGRVEIELSATSWRNEPAYLITVRDFGKGISAENLPQIFDPFFTTGRIHGGTGLGMAIVYNLVTEALHGKIELDSTLGQGTTVIVTVPMRFES